MRDFYRRLKLDPPCSSEEIRQRLHLLDPQTRRDAEYVLLDPERRRVYDRTLSALRSIARLRSNLRYMNDTPTWVEPGTRDFRVPSVVVRGPTDETGWKRWFLLAAGVVLVILYGLGQQGDDERGPRTDPGPREPAPTARVTPPMVDPWSPPAREKRYVEVGELYLRAGPGTNFERVGTLSRFTTVVPSADAGDGWLEVSTEDGREGYVAAEFLAEGDGSSAYRAWCLQEAGEKPRSGEVLKGSRRGNHRVTIENSPYQDAVLKMKRRDGGTVLAVYLGAGATVTVDGVPDGEYKVVFASGRTYSRACGYFLEDLSVGVADRGPRLESEVRGEVVHYKHYRITLFEVPEGNLRTREGRLEEFLD